MCFFIKRKSYQIFCGTKRSTTHKLLYTEDYFFSLFENTLTRQFPFPVISLNHPSLVKPIRLFFRIVIGWQRGIDLNLIASRKLDFD